MEVAGDFEVNIDNNKEIIMIIRISDNNSILIL